VRHERAEKLSSGLRHPVHRPRESLFVRPGGPRRPAQLSDELHGGRADLLVGGRRMEVVQRLDASTHGATPAYVVPIRTSSAVDAAGRSA
jgi:hypothetical protein